MRKGERKIMMKNKFVLIRYVLMLWMVCGASYTQSVASAATYTPQYASSWGYRPLHSTAASAQTKVVGSGFGHASATTYQGTYSTASAAVVATSAPTYSFRSTSVYIPAARGVGQPVILTEGAAYSSPFDFDPDAENPVGEVSLPVGEPLVLLFFALAFLGFRYYRRRNA
jgi:hypothetical protein